jgi:hypothetical protein
MVLMINREKLTCLGVTDTRVSAAGPRRARHPRSASTLPAAVFETDFGNGVRLDTTTKFWLHVSARFYRMLEKLPEHHDDVDLEVLKRVPIPV